MRLRAVLCFALAWLLVAFSAPCAAQSLAIPEAPREVSQPEHSVARWYGWETLSLDVAALGMATMSLRTFDGQGPAGALLGSGALFTYALGAPAVHLLRDQSSRAVTSMGLRVGLPVLGVGLAAIMGRERDDKQHMLVAGIVSVTLAALIDGAALAWQPPPKPQRLALTPLVAWDVDGSALVGASGTF